ncbi:SMI1/KNR4 family protein [Solimonas fluminis]|uniref:SMI1/KNR4 family protein n=1 Tax=Solimonas fluminis TaxID=2086571 RepID=UPI0034503EA0
MDSGVAQLESMLGTPYKPVESIAVSSCRWVDSEARLGLEFPSDYKALIETFGSHAWGGFINTLTPAHANRHLELEARGLRILGSIHEVRHECPGIIPYPVYPESCGLFPWAVTDNGDYLCWLTLGYANWWPTVVIEARGGAVEKHAMTATALIASFLEGSLKSPVLVGPFGGRLPREADPGWEDGCY